MPLSILLGEGDLRSMHPSLRDALLKWYFDRDSGDARPARATQEPPLAPAPEASQPFAVPVVVEALPTERRVTFPEFFQAGLLREGEEIWCRSLKRQQKRGAEQYIKGAKVTHNGLVSYQGATFDTPSKLARTMVNASGGRTPALNGYDYLFVPKQGGLVKLKALRKPVGYNPLLEGSVDDLMQLQSGAFGTREEARQWLRENPLG